MKQLLLFPDPRPLVERLGIEFFRNAPCSAGVYLMRDCTDQVLYVGKAKNLRNRLNSYRVANPERRLRRHLRMLRAVTRIELEQYPDETAALTRESELLRMLKPRFNRAGTWVGPRRFVTWKARAQALELSVVDAIGTPGRFLGPLGSSAFSLRALLARLIWLCVNPGQTLDRMPLGWFAGRYSEPVTIRAEKIDRQFVERASAMLQAASEGDANALTDWIRESMRGPLQPFQAAIIEADLTALTEFFEKSRGNSIKIQ